MWKLHGRTVRYGSGPRLNCAASGCLTGEPLRVRFEDLVPCDPCDFADQFGPALGQGARQQVFEVL